MPLLTIPFPVGTFTVTIRDSSDTIVYGPSTEDNTEFDPGITDPGEYTVEVDNNGAIDTFCFTISSCECPELLTAVITLDDGSYYITFTWDVTEWDFCPLNLGVTSEFTSAVIEINSAGDFTAYDGTLATKVILIGGLSTISYVIQTQAGTTCNEGFVAFDCTGVTLEDIGAYPLDFPFAKPFLSGAEWRLVYETGTSCSGADCVTADINYLQIDVVSSGVPDSGTLAAYDLCAQNYFVVTPNIDYPGYNPATNAGRPRYAVTVTTCCGAVYSDITHTSTD